MDNDNVQSLSLQGNQVLEAGIAAAQGAAPDFYDDRWAGHAFLQLRVAVKIALKVAVKVAVKIAERFS
jgi:hypothetical protein